MVNDGQQTLPHKFAMPKVNEHRSNKQLARIHWQQRGIPVAEHAKELKDVNGCQKDKTHICSHYSDVAATYSKYEALVSLLQRGTSWLQMYKTTVTACNELSRSREREQLAEAADRTAPVERRGLHTAEQQILPYKFAMPKLQEHLSDEKVARIHWQQKGKVVVAHAEHLKQWNETRSQAWVTSNYAVVEVTRRKHEALMTSLKSGTSWKNMYETTVSACKELSSLSAEAAGVTYQMDILFQASILEEAKKDPDLNGLNLSKVASL